MSVLEFKVERFETLESTNTLAQQRANEGAAEGLVIIADYQSGGRGKPGRKWESPAGKNLMFSILIRPPVSAAQAPIVTQIACRAVAKVLGMHNVVSTFKRPNDVMVHGKKICGVLVESSTGGNKVESMVIGIGLNVNANTEEMPAEAVSMKEVAHKKFDREEVFQNLLTQFQTDLQELYAARS